MNGIVHFTALKISYLKRFSFAIFFAFVLGSVSPLSALAQDQHDIPFHVGDIPSKLEVEMLLKSLGSFDGLTDEERERQIDYLYKTIVFQSVMQSAQTYSSCSSEVQTFCSTEPKSEIDACLLRQQDQLSQCCAANIRQGTGVRGITESTEYAGLELPIGSEFSYYDGCQLSYIELAGVTQFGELLVGPGRVEFNGDDQVKFAPLLEGQNYRGLPIGNAEEYGSPIHPTGIPARVAITEDTEYKGIHLETGSIVSFHLTGHPENLSTTKPFVDSLGRQLIGNLQFFATGELKRATLAAAWHGANIELPKGLEVNFDRTGGFESVTTKHDQLLAGVRHTYKTMDTYPNGQLKRLTLPNQSGFVLEGIAYPEMTTLEFSENGAVLRDNFRNKDMSPTHPFLTMYPNSALRELDKELHFGVWELPVGSIIVEDKNGVLLSATLPRPIRFGDIEISAGRIAFSSGGKEIYQATLASSLTAVSGLLLPAETQVSVTSEGKLLSAIAGENLQFDGNPITPNHRIDFNKNKSGLISLELDSHSTLFGHTFVKPVALTFDESGTVRSLASDEPIFIDGIEFDGNWIFFHANGRVQSGILNSDSTIANIVYAAGTEILLNESSTVIHSFFRKRRWPDGKPPEPKAPPLDSTVMVMVLAPERARRMKLMGPISEEDCLQMFGDKDENGRYAGRAAGYSMGGTITAASLGCGTTDAEAGIVARQ